VDESKGRMVPPVEGFDEEAYRDSNPDVRQGVDAGCYASGWDHYLRCGFNENRPGVTEIARTRVDRLFEDGSAYLGLNPDVHDAVKEGAFASGWDHYFRYGCDAGRPGMPERMRQRVKKVLRNDSLSPAPPADLRARVQGRQDLAQFNETGKRVSFDIEVALRAASLALGRNSRILDFGCGCGRIISWFYELHDDSDFYGVDIDGEAIAWCQDHLSHVGKFIRNQDYPPLPYSTEYFDFVYSISIFTHLPEDMQFVWLEELRRVTKKNGYVLLTVHGEELVPDRPRRARKSFRKHGFYYLVGAGTEGLPEFYQTAFHAEDYVRNRWSKYFRVERIIKRGIRNHQDLILCKRVV
jgi:ubiquinone/menaquinone biosynthesis C-methylase UbiE